MKARLPSSKNLIRSTRRSASHASDSPADFDHVVIGAGVVGLAIANELARASPSSSTLLVEQHSSFGHETSSRNSEVIHAGLYYGVDTLKTKLCIRGRERLYDLCRRERIPFRNTKKWIVAQSAAEMGELEKLHAHSKRIDVPTHFLSKKEAQAREPDVRAEAGVLESPTTGIVDSHALMACLEAQFLAAGGTAVYHTQIVGMEHASPTGHFAIHTRSHPAGPDATTTSIRAPSLINAAGLAAIPLFNMLLPAAERRTPHYAKGTYFAYAAPSPRPRTLVYPAPQPGFGGLGTHLTLDLHEPPQVRFGPDVEWVDDPTDYRPNEARRAEALDAIATYLPGIERESVRVDYCGIRPKLRGPGEGEDFYIREEGGRGLPGLVNLMGIESPGLTSALEIGRVVRGMVYG